MKMAKTLKKQRRRRESASRSQGHTLDCLLAQTGDEVGRLPKVLPYYVVSPNLVDYTVRTYL